VRASSSTSQDEQWWPIARQLGLRLQRARIAKGLSQEALAHAAGISTYTYQKFEKGESRPGTPMNPRLRTLIAHPQRVYSREELLTAMFGSNHPSDPHTINTHIRALRQKLRNAQIDPACIHTHHGIGYSFQ